MNQYNYVIKGWTSDDFSDVFESLYPITDFDFLAEQIADEYFNSTVTDLFKCTVGIKIDEKIRWFSVTAEYSVNFYSRELDKV